MDWSMIYKWGAAAGGAALSFLFGGWSMLLGVLLAFVVADYMTGIVAAYFERSLSSNVGLKGIAKKICIFGIVTVGHLVDMVLGLGQVMMQAAIFFYLANELLSMIENVGRIGIPIPPGFSQAVEVLKRKDEK